MINTADIEAGDKVHLENGAIIPAQLCYKLDKLSLFGFYLSAWSNDGRWLRDDYGRGYDIIRIEKALKRVVSEALLVKIDGKLRLVTHQDELMMAEGRIHKITITDGEATIERVR